MVNVGPGTFEDSAKFTTVGLQFDDEKLLISSYTRNKDKQFKEETLVLTAGPKIIAGLRKKKELKITVSLKGSGKKPLNSKRKDSGCNQLMNH